VEGAVAHAVLDRVGLGLVRGPRPVGHQVSLGGVKPVGKCEHVLGLFGVWRSMALMYERTE